MNTHKKKIWLFLLILCIAAATATAALRRQGNRPAGEVSQDDVGQFPIADSTTKPTDSKGIAKRKAKSKKYAQYGNNVGPGLKAVEYYHWPPDFPELPIQLSDAVIIGEVSKAVANLTEDETGVYSEFTIRIDAVLKTDGQAPMSTGADVVADRPGGRVRYPTGEMSQLSLTGLGMPREKRRYLLFLKRGGTDEDYQIITGYELRQGRVYPLDKSTSNTTNFDMYAGSDETSFLNKIREAVAKAP